MGSGDELQKKLQKLQQENAALTTKLTQQELNEKVQAKDARGEIRRLNEELKESQAHLREVQHRDLGQAPPEWERTQQGLVREIQTLRHQKEAQERQMIQEIQRLSQEVADLRHQPRPSESQPPHIHDPTDPDSIPPSLPHTPPASLPPPQTPTSAPSPLPSPPSSAPPSVRSESVETSEMLSRAVATARGDPPPSKYETHLEVRPPPRKREIFQAHARRHEVTPDSEDSEAPNQWNEANSKTVKEWKEDCTEMSYVYQGIRQKYLKKVSAITMTLLILSILREVMDAYFASLDLDKDQTQIKVFKGLNLGLSTIGLVVSGYLKAYGISDIVEKLKEFLVKVEAFLAMLMSETTLPKAFRKDAGEFIKQHKGTYYGILREEPKELEDEYDKMYEKYKQKVARDTDSQTTKKMDRLIKFSNTNA